MQRIHINILVCFKWTVMNFLQFWVRHNASITKPDTEFSPEPFLVLGCILLVYWGRLLVRQLVFRRCVWFEKSVLFLLSRKQRMQCKDKIKCFCTSAKTWHTHQVCTGTDSRVLCHPHRLEKKLCLGMNLQFNSLNVLIFPCVWCSVC